MSTEILAKGLAERLVFILFPLSFFKILEKP